MHIYYSKKGRNYTAEYTNKDLEIKTRIVDNRTTITVVAKEEITLLTATHHIPFHVNFKDLYFLNGYQSWTDTEEYKLSKQLRDIRKSPHIISAMFAMDRYGDSRFYDYSIRKSHGYDLFYSKGEHESFIFNMNYKTAYLIIELMKDSRDIHFLSDVKSIKLKKGEEVNVFDYYAFYNFEEGLKAFHEHFPLLNKKKIFGYTSWYNYYQNINEEIILRDLEALDSRYEVFQIDDGYETFVGDWLEVDPKKFPNGLQPIVKKIHEKGYKAGIWLAPFVVETKSRIYKEHPKWIRKDKKGKPIKTGGNWSGFYALDLDNPEVIEYVTKCLKHYVDMGFDFFKLDFLYAAAYPRYPGLSRCQLQRKAYSLLREILGDKIILGCGAHIFNSYGYFDYLRIGPDVSLIFDDVFYMRLFHRERISTKVTLKNTIYRSIFNNRLFGNDPDVFLLRDDNIQLSKEQKKALIMINALFGSVLFTSDDVATYDEEKNKLLEEALDLFHNAKVLSYKTEGKLIKIVYDLNKKEHKLVYNTEKGVFVK